MLVETKALPLPLTFPISANICNRIDGWTGPPVGLSLSSIMLVDKVRLRTGKFCESNKQWLAWHHYSIQYSLLLQYEMLKKLVTYMPNVQALA